MASPSPDSLMETPPDALTEAVLLCHPALPDPLIPLSISYTYHSPQPTSATEEVGGEKRRFVLGIDEAGRGPALGPMVYAAAYCPLDWLPTLETLGFNDSKALTPQTRANLLTTLSAHPEHLGWSVRVLSPRDISSGMLGRPVVNLNRQSEEATVMLIREILASGVDLAEIYVDALGPSIPYQAYLSGLFPTIQITVQPKADAEFPIVGAASIAAKTTRDAWVESWMFEEQRKALDEGEEEGLGSGYPSDPRTQAWIAKSMDPTFGYPRLVRFSWATIRLQLDKHAHAVKWMDEGQASLIKSFASAQGRDKGRCAMAKDIGLRSVADF